MDSDEKKYWVAFSVFNGIGPLRFKLLINYFESAKKAYNAGRKALSNVGLSDNLISKFLEFQNTFDISSYLLRLDQLGIKTISYGETNYPLLLKEVSDKPIVLYIKCKNNATDLLNKKSVAIVGARKITGYGRQVTEKITQGLVDNNIVVVSGLARGVDGVAHQTVVKSKGLTVGVLGCGLDMIYPPEHIILADQIVECGGALVSEFPLGMQAVPGNFPARNRIISGLSLGVVVTEAAEDSGSLITASCAAEQGREVFAVPGPITSSMSEGTAQLIKKGAKLVTRVEDILEELNIGNSNQHKGKYIDIDTSNLSEDEIKIINLLRNESLAIDDIIRNLNLESSKVGSILSMLEVKGIVRSLGESTYGLN